VDRALIDGEAVVLQKEGRSGGTVAGLAGKGVSGLAAAIANADAFVDELLARLSNGNKPIEREEVA
jgi:hypothetical protein